MINKIKAYFLSIITILTMLAPAVMAPALAKAAAPPNIQNSLNCGAGLVLQPNGTCSAPDQTNKINTTITTVINIFSFVVGVIAVIMIIYGGIRFVLSGGDSTATGAARSTVLYAVIGLVVVALAQIIVRFVLNKTTTISNG